MSLQVTVTNATNLPNIEKFGKIDPQATVIFQGSSKKTEVIKEELNPVWNQKLEWDLNDKALEAHDEVEVFVKDWERVGRNRLLGTARVPLKDLIKSKSKATHANVNLLDGQKRATQAYITLQLKYDQPKKAGMGDSGGDEDDGGVTVIGDDVDSDSDMGGGDETDDGGGGGGGGGGGIVSGSAGGRKRSKLQRKELSTKPQDFQVRVKVWEARQLQGANIHPVCKVSVAGQTKMTRVKHSTNTPVWQEIFFFNYNMSPAELFDEVILIQVFNSRKLRSDALIGSFNFDIGMVYEAEDHCFRNKWLLMTGTDEAQAGVKGYIKISVCVLGAGDEAPMFKKSKDDSDDIESNLLRPAGIQLRKGCFNLRVYRAEDIPQMDPGYFEGVKKVLGVGEEQKELVDPYFVFQFAGKSVKSKTIYTTDHPEWNQELRLGIRFPSMCERMKFIMRDWDRLSTDDTIGTFNLDLSAISSPGEEDDEDRGFLPTFGPTFINFYGSTREFSDLPDEYEDLNLGKGEGVAYRGRALVSLETKLGDYPEIPVDEVHNHDVLAVHKFQRRRKFLLYGAFAEATMISVTDGPVQFELSIGNYGNRLDTTIVPQASTTQPTNAVFDGCNYYFLPWGDNKPCVIVNSHWEDISFRLEPLNILLKMVDRLQTNLRKVQIAIRAAAPTAEVATQLIALLDNLIQDCSKPFPQFDVTRVRTTKLDQYIQEMRNFDLARICQEATHVRDGVVNKYFPAPPQINIGQPMPQVDPTRHKTNELDMRRQEMRETDLARITQDATRLRENATDVNEAVNEIEGYLQTLKHLAIEPQNSVPDVVVWMLSARKRIAYFRVPSYEIMYSPNPEACGKHCNKFRTVFLKHPGAKSEVALGAETIPAMLRLKLWLGLEQHEENFAKQQGGGLMAVFAESKEACINRNAEVYENQINVLGNWTTKGLPRPKYSDVTGQLKLDKDSFACPEGWRWEGEWFISPELSLSYDTDAGHKKFVEDAFECQQRLPAGTWQAAATPYTDVRGDAVTPRDEIEAPEGWEWDDDWQIDLNRGVDEEGFEYCVEFTLGGFTPVEKTYHLCRRRRWVRGRTLTIDPKALMQQEQEEEEKKRKEMAEGWEFAPLFTMKFHTKERRMDLVRRRRWHRKMIAEGAHASAIFSTEKKKDQSDAEGSVMASPRIFLTFKAPHVYQLRAYIYQGRGLLAMDSDSFSDPYAYCCLMTRSQKTEIKKKTLCPTWDQTLIIDDLEIYGEPQRLADNPPDVVIEVFDWDSLGSPEFMGRVMAKPLVKLEGNDPRVPRLMWYTLRRGNEDAGEVLASFELFLKEDGDLPFMPPMEGKLYRVPSGIRPVMQRTAVEVLCWGVRNMKKFQLASVTSPSIEFECGGNVLQSAKIKNTVKNPNFSEPLLFFDVMLPKEELYTPPLNILVRDHRAFGRKPIVGISVLRTLQKFRCEPMKELDMEDPMPETEEGQADGEDGTDKLQSALDESVQLMVASGGQWKSLAAGTGRMGTGADGSVTGSGDHIMDMPEEKEKGKLKGLKKKMLSVAKSKDKHEQASFSRRCFKGEILQDEIDWWSKYYASTGETDKSGDYLDKGYDKVEIYEQALEEYEQNDHFKDFCDTFELKRGKSKDDEESDIVGEFKGLFRVYPLPGDPNTPLPPKHLRYLPKSDPEECIVRIYVIKAVDLQPQDPSGLSDPYIKIKLGKETIKDQENYIPNTLNPVFGRMFEMKALIPVHKDLRIAIMDYDRLSSDDIIGETVIDLENRLLTKTRATCGLPRTYNTSGPNVWRDIQTPKQILEEYCKQNNLRGPRYYGTNSLAVEGKMYNLADFEINHIHNEYQGPAEQRLALHVLREQPLVREHIETRKLFSPMLPNIEQGKLQMWVDIFPKSLGAPGPPCDVTPRQPKRFELRCIIWNTQDVVLEETSLLGEKMSDIYVKGWLMGQEEKQETDVHYRSLDGEGNFNWRFVFPFDYIPPEQTMVVKKKDHFWSLDETEERLPPTLVIQIWDNDQFSPDDFLGTLELNLNHMPKPAKSASKCKLSMLPDAQGNANTEMLSLFEAKRTKGFWPCCNEETGARELAGKVEMELEILSQTEAEEKPAGCAREEPNLNPHLDEPNRPATSFNWLTSPLKSLRFIVWKNFKKYIIGFLIILLIVLLVALFIYAFPGAVVNKIVGT
ncbi:myoferlin-like isoform X9 [Ptychodera flava]|uniref:myoferlin-like isoform X9 n=1 Tax=Ptychodera flava TaxID=63121 RepID=UPI003969F38D